MQSDPKGKTHKQIHSCAMGIPVSAVVVNLCMEEIEEAGVSKTTAPPRKWKRYVNVLAIIKNDAFHTFSNTLNSIGPHISFTLGKETNEQIAFLDT